MIFGEIRKTGSVPVTTQASTPTFFRGHNFGLLEEEDEAAGLTGIPSTTNRSVTGRVIHQGLDTAIAAAKSLGFLVGKTVTPKRSILGIDPGDRGTILFYNTFPEGTTHYGDVHELKVLFKGSRMNMSHRELELLA